MWEKDDLKFVIDDARHRQSALLQLIYFNDQQALDLLKLYVTIGLAAASGATAGFLGNSAIPFWLATALVGAVAALLVGCLFCFRAMRSAQVGLPGKDARFWKAGIEYDSLADSELVSGYLDQIEAQQDTDYRTNEEAATALNNAKWSGVAAPGVALVVGVFGPLISSWFA